MNLPLWFSNLVFWSAQAALLALAAAWLPRLFQLREPRVLLAYWRVLLVACLALPFLQPWHRPPSISAEVVVSEASNVPLSTPRGAAATHWQLPGWDGIAEIAGVVILVGIAARLLFLAIGILKLRRLRLSSSPINAAGEASAVLDETRGLVNASAEFRLSADVDSPVTFGFAKPVILLPERFSGLAPRFQSAIACHELLHVRRRDWAHHLSEEIVRAIFWFHPAIAWLVARVRLAREQVVDREVVRLTQARKPYLEALLEFASGRAGIAVIPAPPFLAEHQLVERVSLMLKEVRMSRTKLIASLTVVSCGLALTGALAVWAFPLKGAPLASQSAPQTGVTGGVSGGVTGGPTRGPVGGPTGGVSGGVVGGIGSNATQDGPNVDYSTIWTDSVKRGPMVRQVRGLGKLVRTNDSKNLVAKVELPELMTKDVQANQNATITTQSGPLAKGHVTGVGTEVLSGVVSVDVALDGPLPKAASAGLDVAAVIDIETLSDILRIGRPVHAAANSTSSVFKITNDGTEAVRVNVKFGRASVSTIEILDGLQAGDKVILSDMSDYDNADHIRLTDEKHVVKH